MQFIYIHLLLSHSKFYKINILINPRKHIECNVLESSIHWVEIFFSPSSSSYCRAMHGKGGFFHVKSWNCINTTMATEKNWMRKSCAKIACFVSFRRIIFLLFWLQVIFPWFMHDALMCVLPSNISLAVQAIRIATYCQILLFFQQWKFMCAHFCSLISPSNYLIFSLSLHLSLFPFWAKMPVERYTVNVFGVCDDRCFIVHIMLCIRKQSSHPEKSR